MTHDGIKGSRRTDSDVLKWKKKHYNMKNCITWKVVEKVKLIIVCSGIHS